MYPIRQRHRLFLFRGDGTIAFSIEGATGAMTSSGIYNATTAAAANVVIDSGTTLRRSTSSRRYKTAIEPLTDWRFLLDLSPVTFAAISDPDGRRYGGLIAEDVAEVNPLFAQHGLDGTPEEVAYTHLVAPVIAAIQDLARRLTRLEDQGRWLMCRSFCRCSWRDADF